jgi:formylglycine-generating enzyme required for sulfatase activity
MKTTRSLIKTTVFLTLLLFTPAVISAIASSSRSMVITELEQESGNVVGNYHALVIGINDYQDRDIPDLKTAVNDAREIADILKTQYGFTEVMVLINDQADSSNIHRSLRKLVTQSKENDSVLIYYAGHGELDPITKTGYWIPYNAKAGDPATYLGNGVVQGYIKAIPGRHVLLVADSCFSGTMFGKARDLPPIIDDNFYATLFKERSRWGMTSGNLTPVSDDGSKGHSVFAYQFLKTLKDNEKPYLTPRDIYQKIGPIVRNNSEQMPIIKPILNTGDEGGEFLFIRGSIDAQKSPVSPSNQLENGTEVFDKERIALANKRRKIEAERLKIQEEQALAKEERILAVEKRKLKEEKLRLKEEQEKTLEEQALANEEKILAIEKRKLEEEKLRLKKEQENIQTARLEPPKPKLKASLSATNEMVAIPAGEFIMGAEPNIGYQECVKYYSSCKKESYVDESPPHKVELNAFYLDKYEVTQKDFERVMGTNPSKYKGGDRPVEQVTWSEAKDYCQRAGKRLPTEAEWEKAFKGGKNSIYPWGDLFASGKTNICDRNCGRPWKSGKFDDGYSTTSPVGKYPANNYGLYDMAGNVWEWSADWYGEGYYKNSPRSNPKGPAAGGERVVRGGSWDNRPSYSRTANRDSFGPTNRYYFVGFRCAR